MNDKLIRIVEESLPGVYRLTEEQPTFRECFNDSPVGYPIYVHIRNIEEVELAAMCVSHIGKWFYDRGNWHYSEDCTRLVVIGAEALRWVVNVSRNSEYCFHNLPHPQIPVAPYVGDMFLKALPHRALRMELGSIFCKSRKPQYFRLLMRWIVTLVALPQLYPSK